ncbi:hypothetical protein K503DRAFT_671843, partial [Rhizopogon vinicolor AM-OR11-026]
SLKQIYEQEVKRHTTAASISYRTFADWHAAGSKYIAIACGGSIYALVIPLQRFNHDQFYYSSRHYSPPLSDIEEDEIEHIIIKTPYDPLAPENMHFKAPRDRAENDIWSAAERSRAKAGERVRSIDGLRKKVCPTCMAIRLSLLLLQLADLYHKGVKKSPDSYLVIPMDIIPNHHLELRNKDDSLMAFVSTGLPSHIRSALEVNLLAALGKQDLLEEADTQLHGCQSFQAMHLSWYNRHCTRGYEAPKDVQPWLLEKEGKRTNHGQMIPYISQDLQQHQRIYETISRIETYLKEDFEMLMEIASVLPGNCFSPAAPFISLVININVRTKAHRDSSDRHLCLVIPVGHFEGGALCLLENGLVLELRSGDVALFRSSEVTHFNLDYRGARASL